VSDLLLRHSIGPDLHSVHAKWVIIVLTYVLSLSSHNKQEIALNTDEQQRMLNNNCTEKLYRTTARNYLETQQAKSQRISTLLAIFGQQMRLPVSKENNDDD